MTSRFAGFALILAAAGLVGCEAAKSSNPTAPSVAGPIPGVNISAPTLLEPAQGFKFKENEQPIRLVVANATTNGVRPLTYAFEVAADPGFGTKLYSRSGVAPGDGKTSVQLDRLEIGRAYYWRAWAEDGANTGAMASAGFEIFPKPAVTPPAAVAPANEEVVSSSTPTLKVQNAAFVGPVGWLAYEFQVATDEAFTRLVAAGIVNQGTGETSFNSTPLNAGTLHFWRVRASDGESSSGWSPTRVFRTAAAAKPPTSPTGPTPGAAAGGGGSCASNDGNVIIHCIGNKYPDRLAAGVSLQQRKDNMAFLRDRIIEAGKCGGLDLGWNLKRGGPELSIDFITTRTGGLDGIDIGFAYDDTSTPLRLAWATGGTFPFYAAYTNSFSCN
jgi:hypothetical protein